MTRRSPARRAASRLNRALRAHLRAGKEFIELSTREYAPPGQTQIVRVALFPGINLRVLRGQARRQAFLQSPLPLSELLPPRPFSPPPSSRPTAELEPMPQPAWTMQHCCDCDPAMPLDASPAPPTATASPTAAISRWCDYDDAHRWGTYSDAELPPMPWTVSPGEAEPAATMWGGGFGRPPRKDWTSLGLDPFTTAKRYRYQLTDPECAKLMPPGKPFIVSHEGYLSKGEGTAAQIEARKKLVDAFLRKQKQRFKKEWQKAQGAGAGEDGGVKDGEGGDGDARPTSGKTKISMRGLQPGESEVDRADRVRAEAVARHQRDAAGRRADAARHRQARELARAQALMSCNKGAEAEHWPPPAELKWPPRPKGGKWWHPGLADDGPEKARRVDEHFEALNTLPDRLHVCPNCKELDVDHGAGGSSSALCTRCQESPDARHQTNGLMLDMKPGGFGGIAQPDGTFKGGDSAQFRAPRDNDDDAIVPEGRLEWQKLRRKYGSLSVLEEALLSPVIACRGVLRLPSGQQLAYTGSFIHFVSDTGIVAKQLPRAPKDSGIMIYTAKDSQGASKLLEVRKNAIRDFFVFFCAHSPHPTLRTLHHRSLAPARARSRRHNRAPPPSLRPLSQVLQGRHPEPSLDGRARQDDRREDHDERLRLEALEDPTREGRARGHREDHVGGARVRG